MFCYVSESSEDKSIQLPKPFHKSTISVEEALSLRRSVRSYTDKPVTLEEVSQLLWAAQGINDERGLRTAPSGGALYPLETYVVAGNVTGLSSGLYRYIPQDHRLIEVKKGDIREGLSAASLGQNCVRSAPVSFVFSSVWQRITKKYGERGKRYAIIEVGHAAQNIYLQAVSLNLGTVVVGAFSDDDVKKLIGMENGEDPLYVMPVGRKQ
ncbi:MAG: SagB/ThcOx family dehydrogenase [Candidatus Latescibacteria bacterium]|nr:SagB/ThcOx family dehydrogenase [Candidatus Latescibacterota bacterium]